MTATGVFRPRRNPRLREEVLEYLWREFPTHCIIMTDPLTRRVIDLATRRAAAHGLFASHQVCSWVTLMVFFGAFFDDDPLFPWAGATLRETRGRDRDVALAMLFETMDKAVNPFLGETGEHYRKALLWALSLRFDAIAADDGGSVDEAVLRWLKTGYPARYSSLTRDQLELLTSAARARAERFGLVPRAGSILCALLISLLGIHMHHDPLHAWLGETLRDETIADPAAKTRKLYDQGISMLRRHLVLERFSQPE